MARISIVVYDSSGAAVTGLSASLSFSAFTRVNADGTHTDLLSSAPTGWSDDGRGYYHVDAPDSLVPPGAMLRYRVDCTAAASPRYQDGLIDQSSISTVNTPADSAAVDLSLKVGDLQPAFEKVLYDEKGRRLDLTGKTVTFRMRASGGSILKVNGSATIVNATAGRVKYQWAGSDTDTAGLFDAEFVVSGGPRTLPASSYYQVQIYSALP